jgi:DNA repair and recombination protein RAD54B
LYAKRKAAKNRASKSWLDGVVCTVPPTTILFDAAGKQIAKGKAGTCVAGTTMEIGNWEIEVQDPVAEKEFLSGAALAGGGTAFTANTDTDTTAVRKPFFAPVAGGSCGGTAVRGVPKPTQNKAPTPPPDGALVLSSPGDSFPGFANKATAFVAVDSFLAKDMRLHQKEGVKFMYQAVMGLRKSAHTNQTHHGCLLAHEMGMGKTLQVIALLWTLLKQSPVGGGITSPIADKVVIITPASLVQNWGLEIKKWLGTTRLEPLLVESGGTEASGQDAKSLFTDWARSKQQRWRVLITSFETLRPHAELVQSTTGGIDVLVCDEAHRLKKKKGDTATINALRKLKCNKRILLSGTPVQNDLGELFAVFDFACPGVLGDYTQFKKIFANPVERSRDKNASKEEQDLGAARGEELQRMTKQFVHRASAAQINANRIPPKTEYVVFCRLTPTQSSLYSEYLKCSSVRRIFSGSAKTAIAPLQALQNLQKLCNSASLLMGDGLASEDDASKSPKKKSPAALDPEIRQRLLSRLPVGYPSPCDKSVAPHHPAMSCKLAVLMQLLTECVKLGDRAVVVSGWTSTLDVIDAACKSIDGLEKLSRLDGSVAPHKRQQLVTSFNAGRGGGVFLLSTKAGGVGLNLIGANRLVLFDSDWNPANDLQALARVWREGQKKPVAIYRLLATGTVEERIFQRQIAKGSVANAVGYNSASAGDGRDASTSTEQGGEMSTTASPGQNPNAFSKEELKNLFTFNPNAVCDTQEALSARGETTLGVSADGSFVSKKRKLPPHWATCAGEAEGGVSDAPLNSAMSLTHALPDGENAEPSKIVSFCVELPSGAAPPVVAAETCSSEEPEETVDDQAGAGDAMDVPS